MNENEKIRICLVNFATKNSGYIARRERMKKSFLDKGYNGDFGFYEDEKELGCPRHRNIPYAFKTFALMKAYEQNYDVVLWVDSSIVLLEPFSKILEHISKHKYMFLLNGWTSGEWCADTALEPLGITREESFTYPHIMACVMGFDFREDICVKFLKEYHARACDGITFKGAWRNDKQQVSKDPRVLGHRHDQTAASIIAWRLGMHQFTPHLLYYRDDKGKQPDTILFVNK